MNAEINKNYLTQDEVDEIVRQFNKKYPKTFFGIFSCKKRKQAKLELIANLLQKKKKDLEEIENRYYSQSHRIDNVENQIEQIKFEITRKRFYKFGIKFPLFADSKELLHLVTFIVSMAERARKNGILALESKIDNANDSLLILGLQLAVDGTEPNSINHILQNRTMWITSRYEFLKAEIIRQGVMAIQSGDNPRIVEQMLVSMLPDNVRKAYFERKKQK